MGARAPRARRDAGDGAHRPGPEATRDAAATNVDPPPTVADAASDRSLAVASDATPDVVMTPDCRCPIGDYFVDVDVGGATLRLDAPYPLFLYCDETQPQLAHPSCGEVYRLSACLGTTFGPPCLYVAVDLENGPIIGHWVDSTGQTSTLVTAAVAPSVASERVGIGTFSATFQRPGGGAIDLTGTFRACMPSMPPCAR